MKLTIILWLLIFYLPNAFSFAKTKTNFEQLNADFLSFFNDYKPNDIIIQIHSNWEINFPAASTERSTDYEITKNKRPIEWDISILSGYFRDIDGGFDVHLLVLCHEMAHHLGGAPYKVDDNGVIRWASMEAQSDYWAAKTCMPNFLKKFPKYLKQRTQIHPEIDRECSREYYTWFNNFKYCLFTSQAALQLAKIHDNNRSPSEPITEAVNPETPEALIATQMDRNSYPSNQCRFDTSFAAALGRPRPPCWYPDLQ